MRQISLKLKNYASNVNIIDSGNLQKRILYVMFWILSILALAYVLFLGNVVWNIVERKSFEKETLTLRSEVLNLEMEYLAISQKVDLNLAKSLGFKEVVKTQFVTRKALGGIKIVNNEI